MKALDALALGWANSRVPMVLQTEAAECGLACLVMLLHHHGHRTDLAEVRRRFGVSLKGSTLQDLIRIAAQIGLAARPIRVELDELSLLTAPCILHWDLNHFVLLTEVGRGGVVIHDPAVGIRRLKMPQVSKSFTGVALELTPTGGFAPCEAPARVRVSALLGRVVGLKRSLAQLLGLALAIEVFAIAGPLFMQWVVDHALVTADRDLLITLALGFSMLLVLQTAVGAMRGWMVMVLSASLKVQGRANLFAHLVNLPAAYFQTRYLGDVMSRFGSQEVILEAITTELVEAVLDGIMASLTLTIMFVFSPALAGVVLLGAVLYGLLRWVSFLPLREASAEAIVWAARRDSHFLETLRGITAIKLFNAQELRQTRWLNLLVETVNRELTMHKLQLVFRTAHQLLLGGLTILVVWLGAERILENAFSVGMLLAFIAYKEQFLSRVSELINKAVDLRMLGLHAERLADIALTPPETRGLTPGRRDDQVPAAVEVRDVRFRYSENDRWVLDGVDFRVDPGEFVAVVGASGCGKTTLLKILASLLRAERGDVLINGEALTRLGVENYRSMIGVVMQDDQLFAGSIADNISFFAANADSDRIKECARLAAIFDDIQSMPMQFNTLIGDMGTVLSGGQKQRVLIARALYHRPGILLLDEATSHLDLGCERAVNAAIRATDVTRIIVAHRPETIRSADRLIVLEQGRVVKNFQVVVDDKEFNPGLAAILPG